MRGFESEWIDQNGRLMKLAGRITRERQEMAGLHKGGANAKKNGEGTALERRLAIEARSGGG